MSNLNADGRKQIRKHIISPLILALTLLPFSGDYLWYDALVFIGLFWLNFQILTLRLYATKVGREVLNIRGRATKNEGNKGYDIVILAASFISFLLHGVIAGLDRRYGWSSTIETPFYPLVYFGAILMFIGFQFFTASMLENRHFETFVRIQDDRDHKVCTTGPYAIVRHPGYSGLLLCFFVAEMFMVQSIYATPIMLFGIAMLLLRTKLEDDLLTVELDGYVEFKKKTPYRILPYVW